MTCLLFTTKQLAEYIGVKKRTVQYWYENGFIKPHGLRGNRRGVSSVWTEADLEKAILLRDISPYISTALIRRISRFWT